MNPMNESIQIIFPHKPHKFSINNSGELLLLGTDAGYRIISLRTPELKDLSVKSNHNNLEISTIQKCDMLGNSNIIALLGGDKSTLAENNSSSNNVMIYDDKKESVLRRLTYPEAILDIRISGEYLFAVAEQKIYVANFIKNISIEQIEILPMLPLISVYSNSSLTMMAYADKTTGHVRIKNYPEYSTSLINCHKSHLAAFTMNREGTMLATASVKGTLVRVFSTKDSSLISELRRGKDNCRIYSLCFNSDSTMLCCTSNKTTVHVFSIDKKKATNSIENSDVSREEVNRNQRSL